MGDETTPGEKDDVFRFGLHESLDLVHCIRADHSCRAVRWGEGIGHDGLRQRFEEICESPAMLADIDVGCGPAEGYFVPPRHDSLVDVSSVDDEAGSFIQLIESSLDGGWPSEARSECSAGFSDVSICCDVHGENEAAHVASFRCADSVAL